MDQSKTALRYAHAFFDLAREKELLDPLKDDMEAIGLLSDQSSEFRQLIESPVLKASEKIRLLESALEGKITGQSMELIRLVVRNRRESFLPAISRHFLALYKEAEGVKTAVLVSAVPLGKDLTDRIEQTLEKESGSKVEMKLQTDPSLIGGFVLRMNDRQIDLSVSNQLRKIRQTLLETNIK